MDTSVGKPKDSLYQYWFFKLNATPLALLVDWILRPERPPHVRVSIQSVISPRVIWHEAALAPPTQDTWIRIGNIFLGPAHTAGQVDNLAWDLELEPMTEVLDPAARVGIVGRMLPLSTRLVSWPAVRFRGRLTYGDEVWEGEAWGSVTHYWGRALPRHWFWLNATVDAHRGIFVESLVADQRLGPLPWPHVRAGYFWLRQGAREHLILHPFTGREEIWGPPDTPVVRAVPWHGEGFAVRGRAHPKTWQKLGDEIINTLTGDARVLGVGDCYGTAGIEWRRPPIY